MAFLMVASWRSIADETRLSPAGTRAAQQLHILVVGAVVRFFNPRREEVTHVPT
jgi:hypothetical protein